MPGSPTFDLRVLEIIPLLLDGYSRQEILIHCAKWKIHDRTVDKYIKIAIEKVIQINTTSIEQNLAIITTNLWRLYRKAKEKDDPKEQHRLLMSLSKILGLDKLSLHINTSDNKRLLKNLPTEALDKLLEDQNEET